MKTKYGYIPTNRNLHQQNPWEEAIRFRCSGPYDHDYETTSVNDAGSKAGDQWIANAMTAKLYMLLSGEAHNSNKSNTFLSVIKGGLPFNEKALSFLTDGQDDVESRERARRFAEIANTIPNSVGFWSSSGGSLGAAYEFWLNTAMYPKLALEAKYVDALVQAKKVIAINYKDYSKYRGEYQRAKAEYNAKKRTNPKDLMLPLLKDACNNAMDAWQAIGSKEAVESAVAEKNKLERNGWASAFQDLSSALKGAKEQSGYLPVEVVPEDFMVDPTAWSKYKFSTSELKNYQDSSSSSWGGGGGAMFGLFNIEGSTSGTSTEVNVSNEGTEMTVEFEYCRTQLVRQWFDTYVLLSQCWWYNGATKAKPTEGGPILSDGASPPTGRLPMFASEAIWIRNLKVRFAKSSSTIKQVEKSLKTAASVSYWLFSASANYENSSSSLDKTVKTTDTSIEFSGTCLGAFLCRVLEKTPNPLPEFLPLNRSDLQASQDVSADAYAMTRVTPNFDPPHKELNTAIAKVCNDLSGGIWKFAIEESLKKKAANYMAQQGPRAAKAFKMQASSYLTKKVASLKENAKDRLAKMAGLQNISGASRTMYDNPHIFIDKPLSDAQLIESATIAAMESRQNLPKSKGHLPDLSEGKGEHSALSIAILTAKKWGPDRRVLYCLFMDGESTMQAQVAQVAATWTPYCGITFRFYTTATLPIDVNPQIRISFQLEGNWSYIGTDCLLADLAKKPTMNLGYLRNPSATSESIRQVVLHEFGHALGAIHEHQSPRAGIPWNIEVVKQYYRSTQGWSDDMIRRQVFDKYAMDQCNASTYDPLSIMHYPIPAEHLTDGRYAVAGNSNLSEMDKSFMRSVYGVATGGSSSSSSGRISGSTIRSALDIVSTSSDTTAIKPNDDNAQNSFLTRAQDDIDSGGGSGTSPSSLATSEPQVQSDYGNYGGRLLKLYGITRQQIYQSIAEKRRQLEEQQRRERKQAGQPGVGGGRQMDMTITPETRPPLKNQRLRKFEYIPRAESDEVYNYAGASLRDTLP